MNGIHAFMTRQMKDDLRACGFSEEQLAELTPQEGDEILAATGIILSGFSRRCGSRRSTRTRTKGASMIPTVIPARAKFLQRQIKHAEKVAEHYRTLNDPDSAAVFEDWAINAQFELEQVHAGEGAS
jgi:hypothetical protein